VKALTLYAAIVSRSDLRVADTIFSMKNKVILVRLSRGASPCMLGFCEEQQHICKDRECMFNDVLSICNPSKTRQLCDQSSFWSNVDNVITKWCWGC